jgi:hypothetical protein
VINGMLVEFADGTRQRFVVSDRARWIAAVREAAGV